MCMEDSYSEKKNMEELQQIMESKKQLIKFGQNGN